jgi:hypothetical protein
VRTNRTIEDYGTVLRNQRQDTLEREVLALNVDSIVIIESRFVGGVEWQHPTDPGIEKREIKPAETPLQLFSYAVCIAQRARIGPEDNNRFRKSALGRGNRLWILTSHEDRKTLFVQETRRGVSDAASSPSYQRRRMRGCGRHFHLLS